jgi:hypothetical protein
LLPVGADGNGTRGVFSHVRDIVSATCAHHRGMRASVAVIGLVVVAVLGVIGVEAAELVAVGKPAPEIARGEWINSAPLTLAGLRGRVVLVEFWTYG